MRILTLLMMAFISTAEVRVKAELKKSKSFMCDDSVLNQKTLINGCLWVRSQKNENLKTLHAEISAQKSDFFVQLKDDKIYFYNHQGLLNLKLRDGQNILLPAGFSVWISEINENKKNEVGVISPIDKSHVFTLASVWGEDESALRNQLKSYQKAWDSNNELAAEYYKSLVTRRLAAIEAEKQKGISEEARASRERQKQQKLLFDRVFNR